MTPPKAGPAPKITAAPPVSHAFTLAVDAMGGDHAPSIVIDGVAIAADRHPAARFLLVGDEARIAPLLNASKRARAVCTIRHAPDVVASDAKPTAALRMKHSSLRIAFDAVAAEAAHGVVSAGNTGAMLALAKIVIKTLPGIDRPAMAAIMPSARGDVVMLDLGANLACDPRNLVEFALLGDMFARTVLGLTAPTIGLLNVGSEELKGDDRIRAAAEVLRRSHIGAQFHGFVEGHDIAAGTTDIVVTDGFTGNVALKTGEGALKLVSDLLRQIFTSSLSAKLGYLLARPGTGSDADLARPSALQWRGVPGAERHGGQIAWRHGCRGFCPCAGRGRGHGDSPLQRTAARGPRPAGGCDGDGGRGRARSQSGGGGLAMAPQDWPQGSASVAAEAAPRAILAGIGAYLPARVVSNDELARTVDTSDSWIRERTGIGQRYLAAPA